MIMNSRFKINDYIIDLNNYIDTADLYPHDHLEQEIEQKMYNVMCYIINNDTIVYHSNTYYIAFFTSPWKRYFAIYFVDNNAEVTLFDLQSYSIV